MTNTCKSCGKPFEASRKRIKYCSPPCSTQGRIVNHRRYSERACEMCGKSYYPNHGDRPSRFCSNSCQGRSQRAPRTIVCEHCSKSFEVTPSRASYARFCSYSCRAYGRCVGITIGVKNPLRATTAKHYEKPYWKKQASRARKRDGYKCCRCGKRFEKGTWQLDVHHIVPLCEGGSDHLSNLESLCRRCHRKADSALQRARARAKVVAVQPTLFDQ